MVNLRKIAIHLNELNCGGAERLMLDQAREFAQRGYLVDLLVYRTRGDFYPKAIEIVNAEENISLISFDSYAFLMSLSKLFKYLRNNESVILVSSISTIFKSLIAKKYWAIRLFLS